ncbi:hypothetical protein [Nostoc sp.]|uniref:hypothetical protein n=1 Tax=Nostoc sp. TaxID=1180 RepID=UPI002FFB4C15
MPQNPKPDIHEFLTDLSQSLQDILEKLLPYYVYNSKDLKEVIEALSEIKKEVDEATLTINTERPNPYYEDK